MKRKFKSFTAFCALLLAAAFTLAACSPKPSEMKIVTKGDGQTLTVGIISDTQLAHNPTYSYEYELHLLYALEALKERGAEAIVFAGDFANLVNEYMYEGFQRVWNYVYPAENASAAPEKIFIMGNHDYWFESDYNGQKAKKQKLFEKYTGESPWSHKAINGFHFIAYSPTASGSYEGKEDWYRAELEKAMADGDKPIFVVTHHNPTDTVYGSTAVDGGVGWGLEGVRELFEGNDRIVSISGHSHYSLIDERSIWQDGFTAIQTQSLSYIELEGGKENGSIPPRAAENPMMMVMKLSPEQVGIERVSVLTGEKHGDDWILPVPLHQDGFSYTTELRAAEAAAPVMTDGAVTVSDGVGKDGKTPAKILNFPAAAGQRKSFVHSYHVTLSQNGEQKYFYRYFSDFYLGTKHMSDTCAFPLNEGIASGSYDVEIQALESFGKTSENALTGRIEI